MKQLRQHPALIVFILGFGLAASSASAQSTLHVDSIAAPGGSGATWQAAFASLQDALDAAVPGDEIRVAAGVYTPTEQTEPGTPRTETFLLADDLTIRGGYAGLSATDNPDSRNFTFYETILTGDLADDDYSGGDNSENAFHVVTADALTNTAVLDGFTITGGNANGYPTHSNGGGLYITNGQPVVTNCVFLWCEAYYGGAVHAEAAMPTLTNCTFLGNAAPHRRRLIRH